MARLSDEELQELLDQANPGVDHSLPPQPKEPPASAQRTADRSRLAAKVRRAEQDGVDRVAPAPEPEELHDDSAQMTTLTVRGPDGTPRRQGAIVDTQTGHIIAEQG